MRLFSSKNKQASVTSVDRKRAGLPMFMSESLPAAFPINEGSSQVGTQEDWLTVASGGSSQSVGKWTDNNYSLTGAITSAYQRALTTRQQYYNTCIELQQYYLYWTIIDVVSSDICNPDTKHNTFRFESEKYPAAAKELNDMSNKLNLNRMIQQLAFDYTNLGEQTLKTRIDPGKGLVGLREHDNTVLAVYENGVPKNYLVKEAGERDLQVKPAYDYIHFVGRDNKIKLTVQDSISEMFGSYMALSTLPTKISNAVKDRMGDCARYGLPFFWGVLPAIRNLQMLEALVPAIKLNQASQQQFVQVKMASNISLKDLKAALAKYEQILNTPFAMDFSNKQVSSAEMVSILGRIRALPNFTEDEKGTFNTLDLRKDQSIDDLTMNANMFRKLICGSLGVPVTLIFGADDASQDKASELRLFSRYTRKLANLQYGLEQGLMQIALIHLRNCGDTYSTVTKGDIEVNFLKPLTDIGDLESLEFNNARISIVKEVMLFAQAVLADPLCSLGVDRVNMLTWLRDQFQGVSGGIDLFLKDSVWDKKAIQALVTALPPMIDSDGQPLGDNLGNTPAGKPKSTASNGNGKPSDKK